MAAGDSATVTPHGRWAAVYNAGALDVVATGSNHAWRRIATDRPSYDWITIGAPTDSSALVVWVGDYATMYVGTAGDSCWSSSRFPHAEYARIPRLRRDGRGRWLLVWATVGPEIHYSYFEKGQWSVPAAVRCAYTDDADSVHTTNSLDISYDDASFPALTWTADSYRTGRRSLCVAVPVEGKPRVGEVVEGVSGAWIPTIARDRFSDVWLAWTLETPFGFDGAYWQHTYASVTSTAPVVQRRGRKMYLQWTMTGPAPGSHWTVFRAQGSDRFEAIGSATVADDGETQEWVDEEPPAGRVRYRLQRDCMDERYRWQSEEGLWPQRIHGPSVFLVASSPMSSIVHAVDVEPGPLTLQVFDIQGRVVREMRTGADTLPVKITISHDGLGTGVYFVRVTNRLGAESGAKRIVVLR